MPSLHEIAESQEIDYTSSSENETNQSHLAETDETQNGEDSKNEDKTKVILPLITELGLNDSDANKLPN